MPIASTVSDLSYQFLRCTFEVLKPITHLDHFPQALWSAMLRYGYNPYLKKNEAFHETGLLLSVVDYGVMAYDEGDRIELGLAFPVAERERLLQALTNLEKCPDLHGQFEPGNTIRLLQCECRIANTPWPEYDATPLTKALLQEAIEALMSAGSFHVQFVSPLRLKRPPGWKTTPKVDYHRFYNEDFWAISPQAVSFFLQKVLVHGGSTIDTKMLDSFVIQAVYGGWYDLQYGRTTKIEETTLGGFLGKIALSGEMTEELAYALLRGQWLGVGKNRSFGFGQYQIPEVADLCPVAPLTKHTTLLKATLNVSDLEKTLYDLKDSTPGPNGVTLSEMKKLGTQGIKKVVAAIEADQYQVGTLKSYRLEKETEGTRLIQVANVEDKLLQKQATKVLSPVVNQLLNEASYAYREGFSPNRALEQYHFLYRAGFCYGLKADIESFFDSIDRVRLYVLLDVLFPQEPLIPLIKRWLEASNTPTGIPQGSPLSPILSNLFLEQFDAFFSQNALKLIRYSDDFLVLFRREEETSDVLSRVQAKLAMLGLNLSPAKTQFLSSKNPLPFLGYQLLEGEVTSPPLQEAQPLQDVWNPLFEQDWDRGKPIYITSRIHQVLNENNALVLVHSTGLKDRIPWQSIASITVVGKARLSGSIYRRALEETVPIFFQHLNGTPYGQLLPEKEQYRTNLVATQRSLFQDTDYCLAWAKSIIIAQVHNRQVLLRRHRLPGFIQLAQIKERVNACHSLEELRGIEGNWARQYFREFAKLVDPFPFEKRVYHPPDGPINAILSLGYMLLYHRLNAALLRVGLDTRTGFFHQGRGTHAALASDLMEELRYLVERVVIALIHLNILKPEDFVASRPDGPLDRLSGEGFRAFIQRFEKTMSMTYQSKGNQQAISYNAYLDEMAEKTSAALKLEVVYPPRMAR